MNRVCVVRLIHGLKLFLFRESGPMVLKCIFQYIKGVAPEHLSSQFILMYDIYTKKTKRQTIIPARNIHTGKNTSHLVYVLLRLHAIKKKKKKKISPSPTLQIGDVFYKDVNSHGSLID